MWRRLKSLGVVEVEVEVEVERGRWMGMRIEEEKGVRGTSRHTMTAKSNPRNCESSSYCDELEKTAIKFPFCFINIS